MSAGDGPDPREVAAQLVATHDVAWVTALLAELNQHLLDPRLERITRLWDVSGDEMGAFFGHSYEDILTWAAHGVPATHVSAVADLEAATDLLAHHLAAEKIPAVVRRTAPGLQGESLLSLAVTGRSTEVRDVVERMFTLTEVHA